MNKINKNYIRNDVDLFLNLIRQDDDFIKILKQNFNESDDISIGLSGMTGYYDKDSDLGKRIIKTSKIISDKFYIKQETAEKLILRSPIMFNIKKYTPYPFIKDNQLFIRIGADTTQKDIIDNWNLIKEEQKKIKINTSKTSTNQELAYCIHKQIINGKSVSEAHTDYINGKLEGYNKKPTIFDYNDFRKYYKNIVKGL